ncbi:hypothetical protein BGZ68_002422, partial [Mortierella alpina]
YGQKPWRTPKKKRLAEAEKSNKGKEKEQGKQKDEAKKEEEFRTCTSNLRAILHPDLQQHYDRICEIVKSSQISITNAIHELSFALRKAVHVTIKESAADTDIKDPAGLSQTMNAHVNQLAVAHANLWTASVFDKAMTYSLRVIFRLHLAPQREARLQERLKTLRVTKRE